jgi:hypothetical protein
MQGMVISFEPAAPERRSRLCSQIVG